MKSPLVCLVLAAVGVLAATTSPRAAASDAPAAFDQAAAVAQLQKEIAGKEDKPSSEVFKNIKMLKKMPAGHLLKMMEFGWSKALGVDCTHCHVPGKWDSDEKRQKEATREMAAMMGRINKDLLPAVQGLRTEPPAPFINCTTCHRGQVKPALELAK